MLIPPQSATNTVPRAYESISKEQKGRSEELKETDD